MPTGPDQASKPRLPQESKPNHAVRFVLLVALALSLAWFAADKFWLTRQRAGEVHGATGAATQAAAAGAAIDDRSIVVLPFANTSPDPEQAYYADGLAAELRDRLAQVSGLRVPGHTSSFYFKGKQATTAEIGRALAVAYVLDGRVSRSGGTLHVIAQLTRADHGERLWSKTYERDARDVFAVQDAITQAVVESLHAPSVPPRRAANPQRPVVLEAYDQYLMGNSLQDRDTRDGWRLARDAYRKAVALDPDDAAAYVGLTLAETAIADATGDDAGNRRALAAAERAVVLAPDLAAGYAVRGYMRYSYAWDWGGAQADFEKALALDPIEPIALRRYAGLLESLGRLPEAIVVIERLIKSDPLSDAGWMNLGLAQYSAGRIADARQSLSRALEINADAIYGQYHRGFVELIDGKAQNALALFRQVGDPVFVLTGGAMAEHTLGHERESRQMLDELVRSHARTAAFQIAEVYAWCGGKDQAFSWLERAYRQRDGGLSLIKTDPPLAALHGDLRFAAMLRKMKLPE